MRWMFSFWELHDKIRKTRRIKGKVRPRAVRGRMRFEKRMAMEALRKLLYAEMSREEYKACLPDIQRSNRQRVTAYLGIACAFLTVLCSLIGFVIRLVTTMIIIPLTIMMASPTAK